MVSAGKRAAGALGVLVIAVCGACSEPGWTLPDRADPAVRAEESRLAEVIKADGKVNSGSPIAECKVRLLGQQSETTFAYARCASVNGSASAMPVAVHGSTVEVPTDQAYGADLKRLFPPGLVRLVAYPGPGVVP